MKVASPQIGNCMKIERLIIKPFVKSTIANRNLNRRWEIAATFAWLKENAYQVTREDLFGVGVLVTVELSEEDEKHRDMLNRLQTNAAVVANCPNLDLDTFIDDWAWAVPDSMVAFEHALHRVRGNEELMRSCPYKWQLQSLCWVASLMCCFPKYRFKPFDFTF